MILALLLAAQLAPATAILSKDQQTLAITNLLAIPLVGKTGRAPFPVDPIQYEIVTGAWHPPKENEIVIGAEGKPKQWKLAQAGKDGLFIGDAFEGGYAYATVYSDVNRIILLRAIGDSMVYVNGEPRMGDPYSYGFVTLPIKLHKGDNTFLFATGRGQLKVQLESPRKSLTISAEDATLPDLLNGESDQLGAVVVLNCSEQRVRGYKISTAVGAGGRRMEAALPEIAPLSVSKVPIHIVSDAASAENRTLFVSIRNGGHHDDVAFPLRIRTPQQTRKETYKSAVDGSVQYYAVFPPPKPSPNLALILSLHGASVEATGQADAYSPKDWAWIVCPTNRRPFGFDWEDWGRQDGMDVLEIAAKKFQTDRKRTYLTGHSMGGHGTWQLGAVYPDRFAAIGVSAGWSSFFSYVGTPRTDRPTPMQDIFQRANGTSATLDMKNNFKSEGVYILHGDADDNVPITEARGMRDILSPFHKDLAYHEQKGAGHWWDGPAAPGADCLEWPDMMDFLRAHTLRKATSIDFTTCNLAVNNHDAGVTVLEQRHPLAPSRITVSAQQVETSNITRFQLSKEMNTVNLVIDGHAVNPSPSGCYALIDNRWKAVTNDRVAQIGPFKQVFNNHVMLVYGTKGTPAQNEWAYNKARFDSESFWYRGNATLPLMSDREFSHIGNPHQNIVLYGNADCNATWRPLLGSAPIQVRNHAITVGGMTMRREDLACLFCWRKSGKDYLVAAVSGTGLKGMRLTERMPYFVSGVGYPDWMIDSPESLRKGLDGVIAAGFFGTDGKLASGDYVGPLIFPNR